MSVDWMFPKVPVPLTVRYPVSTSAAVFKSLVVVMLVKYPVAPVKEPRTLRFWVVTSLSVLTLPVPLQVTCAHLTLPLPCT